MCFVYTNDPSNAHVVRRVTRGCENHLESSSLYGLEELVGERATSKHVLVVGAALRCCAQIAIKNKATQRLSRCTAAHCVCALNENDLDQCNEPACIQVSE